VAESSVCLEISKSELRYFVCYVLYSKASMSILVKQLAVTLSFLACFSISVSIVASVINLP